VPNCKTVLFCRHVTKLWPDWCNVISGCMGAWVKLSGDANHKCLSSLLKRLAYQMQNTYRSEGIRKGADSVRLSSSMTVIAYPGTPHSLVLCCPTLSYLTKSAPCPLHLEIAIVCFLFGASCRLCQCASHWQPPTVPVLWLSSLCTSHAGNPLIVLQNLTGSLMEQRTQPLMELITNM
jgi:hypothetical protein